MEREEGTRQHDVVVSTEVKANFIPPCSTIAGLAGLPSFAFSEVFEVIGLRSNTHSSHNAVESLLEPILREACSQGYPVSAICVQRFDDSLSPAIRITYRISLRSSSLREPRYPLLTVVLMFRNVVSELSKGEYPKVRRLRY